MPNDFVRAITSAAQPAVAPLVLDPLMARIAAHAGFQFGYVSGGALGYSYAVSEALLSLTEIASVTRRITQRCELGVVVDIGVGFGDPVHVARAMWEFTQAGAAAVEIEDQVAPKRVSHHRGIEHLVTTQQMTQKIAAAVTARGSDGPAIIARTGAVKNEDFSQAISRLRAYHEAGADVLMLMPQNREQVLAAREQLDVPLAAIIALDQVNSEQWQNSGWNLFIDPFTAQVLGVQAVQNAYSSYLATGSTGTDTATIFSGYRELPGLAGLPELYAIEDASTEAP